MLTRLFAVLGGASPHNSDIRLSVGTSWPERSSRHASSDRHLAALIASQPSGDSTSSGPRMRKRIRPARPNARSPPPPVRPRVRRRVRRAHRMFGAVGVFRVLWVYSTTTQAQGKSDTAGCGALLSTPIRSVARFAVPSRRPSTIKRKPHFGSIGTQWVPANLILAPGKQRGPRGMCPAPYWTVLPGRRPLRSGTRPPRRFAGPAELTDGTQGWRSRTSQKPRPAKPGNGGTGRLSVRPMAKSAIVSAAQTGTLPGGRPPYSPVSRGRPHDGGFLVAQSLLSPKQGRALWLARAHETSSARRTGSSPSRR